MAQNSALRKTVMRNRKPRKKPLRSKQLLSVRPKSVQKSVPPKVSEPPFCIAGIGASAGGLEAFEQFFSAMPPDSNVGICSRASFGSNPYQHAARAVAAFHQDERRSGAARNEGCSQPDSCRAAQQRHGDPSRRFVSIRSLNHARVSGCPSIYFCARWQPTREKRQ